MDLFPGVFGHPSFHLTVRFQGRWREGSPKVRTRASCAGCRSCRLSAIEGRLLGAYVRCLGDSRDDQAKLGVRFCTASLCPEHRQFLVALVPGKKAQYEQSLMERIWLVLWPDSGGNLLFGPNQ